MKRKIIILKVQGEMGERFCGTTNGFNSALTASVLIADGWWTLILASIPHYKIFIFGWTIPPLRKCLSIILSW